MLSGRVLRGRKKKRNFTEGEGKGMKAKHAEKQKRVLSPDLLLDRREMISKGGFRFRARRRLSTDIESKS